MQFHKRYVDKLQWIDEQMVYGLSSALERVVACGQLWVTDNVKTASRAFRRLPGIFGSWEHKDVLLHQPHPPWLCTCLRGVPSVEVGYAT